MNHTLFQWSFSDAKHGVRTPIFLIMDNSGCRSKMLTKINFYLPLRKSFSLQKFSQLSEIIFCRTNRSTDAMPGVREVIQEKKFSIALNPH